MNQQQVGFGIHTDDLQITTGRLRGSVLTGHPLALEQTTGVSTHTRTTSVAVTLLYTVRRTLTGKVMPLHDTRKTATLTGPGNVNSLNLRERVDFDFLA